MAIPNTTPTKVVVLAPDGWKRTGFPDGTLPPPSAPPEFTTSTTSSSITATITNANGATSYEVRVDLGTAESGLTKTGLSSGTSYSFQVKGHNDQGSSDWSTAVTVTTVSEGLTDPARLFTITRTFEGTDGVRTSLESDGFDGLDSRSFYSNEQAANGLTSGKMTVLTSDSESAGGGGGFGNWGGRINFATPLQEGDEVFFRVRMYFPAGFDHYTTGGGGHIKWLRVRTEDTGGQIQGYNDIYWEAAGQSTTYKYIMEGPNLWNYFGDSGTYPHLFDQWVTFNVHYIFNTDPSLGRARVWQGADLILDSAEQTLNVSTHLVGALYVFTYWNGDVPQNQSCYIDDVVITSDRAQTMSHSSGNPWIGV